MDPDKIVESPTHPYKDKPTHGNLPQPDKKTDCNNC